MDTYSHKVMAVNNHINDQQHFIFHISSHAIAFIALIIACFAITGYIRYRRLPKDAIIVPKKGMHPPTAPPGHPPVNNRTLNDISHIDTNIYHPSDSMLPYVMVSSTDHNVQTPGALQMSALDIYIDESDTTLRTGFMQSNGFFGPLLKDDPNFGINGYNCSATTRPDIYGTIKSYPKITDRYPGICNSEGSFKDGDNEKIWTEGDTSGEQWGYTELYNDETDENLINRFYISELKVNIGIVGVKCALSCQNYQEATYENVPTYICKLPTIPNGQIVSGFFECLAENTFENNFKPTLFVSEDDSLSATNSNSNVLNGEYLTNSNGPNNFNQGDKVNFTQNNKVPLRTQKYLYIKTNTNIEPGEYSGSFHIHLKITSSVPH